VREFDFSVLSRLNSSALVCAASIREQVDYFQVNEKLPFEPDGEGGHVWLLIQKRGMNTDWVAKLLAEFAQVPAVDIGYAGLKDRHAVTTQWFSVKTEGKVEPDWALFNQEGIEIVQRTRHGKKLKRGVLEGNWFALRLTDCQGDKTLWQQSLNTIKKQGVPNYFAEQRFGHKGNNLARADHWFATGRGPNKRQQKSIYLSAARSWLFNLVLNKRLEKANWNCYLQGDVMLLSGTKGSIFRVEEDDETLQERLDIMDIHPTGPLWGKGRSSVSDDCLALELAALSDWQDWQAGLERAGLEQSRRALRLFPQDFEWQFLEDNALSLRFFLPSGCYATAVMRELAVITDISVRNN
jgi:tRNA pseudouridine13 synthase